MDDIVDYKLMTDEEIILHLAKQFERLRIKKQIKETEIEASANISRKILYNFRKGTTTITLKSFIRMLRGIGELDRLQSLLTDSEEFSPRAGVERELPKRVRDRVSRDKDFKWGDEE